MLISSGGVWRFILHGNLYEVDVCGNFNDSRNSFSNAGGLLLKLLCLQKNSMLLWVADWLRTVIRRQPHSASNIRRLQHRRVESIDEVLTAFDRV